MNLASLRILKLERTRAVMVTERPSSLRTACSTLPMGTPAIMTSALALRPAMVGMNDFQLVGGLEEGDAFAEVEDQRGEQGQAGENKQTHLPFQS